MIRSLLLTAAFFHCVATSAQAPLDESDLKRALGKATEFMSKTVADHGGYAWTSSADGRFSNGEGVAGPDRVWVQPPGTPAVGEAFLKAFLATGDQRHLDAARATGEALIRGQLRSGGWGYSIDFDPARRTKIPYRVEPQGVREKIAITPKPGGWDIWRKRQYKSNMTLIDDDTTPSAIRFLARLDQTLGFKDVAVHDATRYALRSTLGAQYPIGAWGHNFDRFGTETPSVSHYPILSASYPKQWSRVSTNDFQGCYMLNDRITLNMIRTMLLAGEIYDDDRYRKSAMRGGEFLIRAQMPKPQPAWAQQYDRQMRPVWDRKFEPPAITGGESQDVLRTLLVLYEATQDDRFLKPIPVAVAYFKTLLRPDGRLARYYELKTNRPLYFTKDYKLTNDDREMPDHYGFVIDSGLDQIEAEYDRISRDLPSPAPTRSQLADRVTEALRSQRGDGAWLTPGFVRDGDGRKVVPDEGVVQSQTFIDYVELICEYLDAKPSFGRGH